MAIDMVGVTKSRAVRRTEAFTLLELMVVVAIMIFIAGLLAPALTSLKKASDVTTSSYTIIDALQNARTYAIANSTFVWVGFFEEDPTASTLTNPRQPGIGRVVVSIVASSQGTRYKDTSIDATNPHAFYSPPGPSPIAGDDSNPVILTQVGKLIKIDGAHLATLGSSPTRPAVSSSYQVAASDFNFHPPSVGTTPVLNPTTFNYPLTASGSSIQYTFVKIIEFNPRGAASKIVDLPTSLLEAGLQTAHGNAVDNNSQNHAAVQLSTMSGRPKIYRQ